MCHLWIPLLLPVILFWDEVSCGGEGNGWRMWALTCQGHRRRTSESINGVAVSEKRRADAIAMSAQGIVLSESTLQAL